MEARDCACWHTFKHLNFQSVNKLLQDWTHSTNIIICELKKHVLFYSQAMVARKKKPAGNLKCWYIRLVMLCGIYVYVVLCDITFPFIMSRETVNFQRNILLVTKYLLLTCYLKSLKCFLINDLTNSWQGRYDQPHNSLFSAKYDMPLQNSCNRIAPVTL